MRPRALLLVPFVLLACGREPAAPRAGAAMNRVIYQSTGSFDIYVHDVLSGTTRQATALADAGEFNAAFSPNGRWIVHDVVTAESHDLYITEIATRASTPLVGGEGGNDADWSPNGLVIAFDRWADGEPSVYTVRASGGIPTLARPGSRDPQWGPDSRRLVVTDVSGGSIRTIELATGIEHVIAPFGANPAWSTSGRHIAYTDGNSLFVVAVDPRGAPVGAPRQLTFDGEFVYNQQPSWSNGETIVFHSNRGDTDFDLWVVSASGGEPTRLTGTPGEGDYDPAFYERKLVAFSTFTPAGP